MLRKTLCSALHVLKKLKPVGYDQTYNLVDQYTLDTPQYYQCCFIAQAVQQIEELTAAVIGGEIREDGKINN